MVTKWQKNGDQNGEKKDENMVIKWRQNGEKMAIKWQQNGSKKTGKW